MTDSMHLFGSTEDTQTATSLWWRAAAVVIGAALWRALLSWWAPIFPDEAYYWLWTRRLEAGFFDHPPGIALLIAAGTRLFGNGALGIRAGPATAALLVHVGMAVAAWRLAGGGLPGARAAWRVVVLVAVIPLSVLGLVIATPDVLLLATVVVAYIALDRALLAPLRSLRGLVWWTVCGVFLGASFVAKYTAVLLPLSVLLAFLLHPQLRPRFADLGPWWASLIATAIFAPVVLWNYLHDWISFRFQLGHGFGAIAPGNVFSRELELVGGQLGLASPILFVLLGISILHAWLHGWRVRHDASSDATRGAASDAAADARQLSVTTRRFVLASSATLPLLFFAISAMRRSVEPNWPAVIYPPALLLLATDPRPFAAGVWWRRGVGLAFVLALLATLQVWKPVAPIAARRDPIARAHGWARAATVVDHAQRDPFLEGTVDRWIAAERYQEAAELTFHLPGQPTVFSLNLNGRVNQFDLWETALDEIRPGDGLVAVFDDNPVGDSLALVVAQWFQSHKKGESIVLARDGDAYAHRRVWLYRIAVNVPPRRTTLPTLSAKR
ncbi:MAG: glycosyltransferase family 39 protein [Gemmatimonadaceae bacterium]|nr:glycosyltransferase family 39 protein [Gemmatimonadaceae bacterium]